VKPILEQSAKAGRTSPRPPKVTEDPHESRWRLRQGDEIAPGRSAIKLLGGGLRYEAYLAWDERLHSLVVVKVVRPGLVGDRRTLEGLAEEVTMLDRLHHPVLLRGFAADLSSPRPHVVLEHLEGPRLSTLLRTYGPLPSEQLLPLGVQLCAAAHYMAAEGVVHLDIKPSNIIMGAPARLIDLSVARTIEDCAGLRSAVGTDSYMSPEQCLPGRGGPVGPAADVWGIGVTLYRAMTGERPFAKGDPDGGEPALRWPQLEQPPASPVGAPPVLAGLVLACLAYDPLERPTAHELFAELERLADALPKPWLSKLKPRPGRR
jgi:serine/threonine protein kinase